MKVAILCGGEGTRMKEITEELPKPLVMLGDRPILWHIMKIYMHYGFNDFVLLLGYKGEKIKEYFINETWRNHDLIYDGTTGDMKLLQTPEKWKITFVDTGEKTMTGGRIKKAQAYLENEPFFLTYGDGLANIQLRNLLTFHREKGKIATITGVPRRSQYGILKAQEDIAISFQEKRQIEGLINGGFFVLNPEIFRYLESDPNCILERAPLENLVKDQQLAVYQHEDFWISMDTYKDIVEVNKIWKSGKAPWKVW